MALTGCAITSELTSEESEDLNRVTLSVAKKEFQVFVDRKIDVEANIPKNSAVQLNNDGWEGLPDLNSQYGSNHQNLTWYPLTLPKKVDCKSVKSDDGTYSLVCVIAFPKHGKCWLNKPLAIESFKVVYPTEESDFYKNGLPAFNIWKCERYQATTEVRFIHSPQPVSATNLEIARALIHKGCKPYEVKVRSIENEGDGRFWIITEEVNRVGSAGQYLNFYVNIDPKTDRYWLENGFGWSVQAWSEKMGCPANQVVQATGEQVNLSLKGLGLGR